MILTRGFVLPINTQTGATERWAAGDPASVAEHLDAARERMQAANVPTLEQISESITPVTGPEVLGKVITHSPAGEVVARSGRARQIAVEYAAGDDSAPVVGVHVWSLG